MQNNSYTIIRVSIVFLFNSFKAMFFLQGKLIFFTVTNVDEWIFHQTYQFPYHPRVWPVVRIAVTIRNLIPIHFLYHLVGDMLSAVQEKDFPNKNAKRTTIHHRSLVPWGVSREGVFHKCFDLPMSHPKNTSDQGMLTYNFPRGRRHSVWARMLYHVWLCLFHPWDLTLFFSSLSLTIQLEKKTLVKW